MLNQEQTNYSLTIRKIYIFTLSIIFALIIISTFLLTTGYNPYLIFKGIITGALGNTNRIQELILKIVPLSILSLGVSFAFKMKFWNIGAEGQFVLGAIFASYFALFFNDLPSVILIPIEIIAGFVGGALWGVIPAYFKATYNTNETIFTLLMNYISISILTWLQYSLWKSPTSFGFPKIDDFPQNAVLPMLGNIHIGWVFVIILVIFTYIYINKTKSGFELSIIGESSSTSKYIGINIKSVIIKNMIIGAGFCGIAGTIEAIGTAQTISTSTASGLGYTAIIIAWLANLNALYIILVSVLFSILIQGVNVIQFTYGISFNISEMIQGVILFCVLASNFFVKDKIKFSKKGKK